MVSVSQGLWYCRAELLRPMSLTLPKMHEQRPRALVKSCFYLTEQNMSCWLRSLVGMEVGRYRGHSMDEELRE